jgi:hypothetical protein
VLDPKGPIAPGFDRGFSVYDAGFERRRDGADPYKTKERRGAEVVARALAWLAEKRSGPVFLWVHLYDAHDPYDAPAPFASRFARAPYDGEIAGVDAAFGRLVEGLRKLGRLDGALMAVAADHGESLGEHGEDTHGVFLYDATIHVPLLVRLPQGAEHGRRVPARASLVDLAPTLLEGAGVAVPEAMQGHSLLPLARGERTAERPAYAESEYSHRVFGWSPPPRVAVRALPVHRGAATGAVRRACRSRLDAQRRGRAHRRRRRNVGRARGRASGWSATARPAAPAKADPELVERLASLGYAAGATAGALPPPSGVDPKDKIQVTNLLQQATEAGESGRWDCRDPALREGRRDGSADLHGTPRAGPGARRAGASGRARCRTSRSSRSGCPTTPTPASRSGLAYASLGRKAEAIAELRAALAKEPGHKAAAALLEKLQVGTLRATEGSLRKEKGRRP